MMLLFTVSSVQAQSLGDLLSGIGKTVAGNKLTSENSLKGTWKYSGPACLFESDNLLAKAGGSAASTKIESKVAPIVKNYVNGIVFTFDGEGNYTSKLKTRVTKGTYTFDSDKKTITFKPTVGKAYTAYVAVTGSEMTLVFNANKLMSILKTISNSSAKTNSTASTINSLLQNYNGMRLGFRLKK